MNKRQVAKIRSAIIKACDAHIKSGGKILRGSFRYSRKCMCPLSCTIKGKKVSSGAYDKTLAKVFGLSDLDAGVMMWSFVRGFDSTTSIQSDPDSPFFLIGRELRTKYAEHIVHFFSVEKK